MSYLRNFFGGGEEPSADNSELVEKFVERLETASTLPDKRNALKGLRSCAKNARLLVATAGMHLYMQILDTEEELDIIAMVLEILNAVLGDDEDNLEEDICDRLAELIVRKPVFMPAILKCLENDNFAVRKNAIQLLTTLLRHRAGEVQEAIVKDPTGTSRIVDLLNEQREVIRNHVVLMLSELSRGNIALQQLLVFQNCFQMLFEVIENEPADSIVVEDCLFVILNLLKKNANNQELFREASLINRLLKLTNDFLYPPDDFEESPEADWLPQKTANFIFILQVIRTLVSPTDNTHANTHASQRAILQTGLIQLLVKTLLSEFVVTVDVLSETAVTVADVIRGNYANQQFLASSTIQTPEGEKSALMVLLMSMTTEKQLFRLRCSVFYCFLCYLYGNDTGKQRIINSLLPTAESEDKEKNLDDDLWHYLCAAIISAESVQVWFGAVCLIYTLYDADHLKPQLLRVQMSTVPGEEPSSLLNHIGNLLVSLGARRLQTRCALLMLLGVWLQNCGEAVEEFLHDDRYLEYLTSHLNNANTELKEGESQVLKGLMAFVLGVCVHYYDSVDNAGRKKQLMDTIQRRVGLDQVADGLDSLSKSEYYIRAAQKPLPSGTTAHDLLLEYQFTKLFKSSEGILMKIFRPNGDYQANPSNTEAVVTSYKKLIKQQDEQIAQLRQELDRAKLTSKENGTPPDQEPKGNDQKTAEIQELQNELSKVKERLRLKEEECIRFSGLAIQAEQMATVARQWQSEAERYKAFAEQWQTYQLAQLPNPQDAVIGQLTSQIAQMEQQLKYGWECFEGQSKTYTQAVEELERTKVEVQRLNATLDDANKQLTTSSFKELISAKNELNSIRREHDDTLLLLAEQDAKLTNYRRRLRKYNEPVTDDEEDLQAQNYQPQV
ncbi:unnamed protein product [Bursaphelenchus xylophilus]|uniref:(pine wood nematode) hypothetical protein n=1 Tax=Bursaphelenchus xylophilus TaxID=6326 RepID=A0A1I7S3Y9_BURXY|nr:unnamed protein product [Bursaphelenchus xylophilus]CAG9116571.1 unnamed protein product [Bursaphelenchus xylophilus]